jgi:hypothetical protein
VSTRHTFDIRKKNCRRIHMLHDERLQDYARDKRERQSITGESSREGE